jgi:hypothetical protein
MDELKIWIMSEFFQKLIDGLDGRELRNGVAYELAQIHLYGDAKLDSFLSDKKADYVKQQSELDAKYAAQKQAEADKILLEQAKIDEILASKTEEIKP